MHNKLRSTMQNRRAVVIAIFALPMMVSCGLERFAVAGEAAESDLFSRSQNIEARSRDLIPDSEVPKSSEPGLSDTQARSCPDGETSEELQEECKPEESRDDPAQD